MKNILILKIFLLCTTVIIAENNQPSITNKNIEAPVTVNVSKGEAFMTAFGMGNSSSVSSENSTETTTTKSDISGNANSSNAASIVVGQTSAVIGASSLTNIQNTPYMN